MKFEHEGKEYEIDLTKAKELGLCKEILKEIKNVQAGDVFKNAFGTKILIVEAIYKNTSYNIAGLCGLRLFSDFRVSPKSKSELLEWLNHKKYVFVKNINDEIDDIFRKA